MFENTSSDATKHGLVILFFTNVYRERDEKDCIRELGKIFCDMTGSGRNSKNAMYCTTFCTTKSIDSCHGRLGTRT